eukprot:TCONS_00025667-protein
MAIHLKTFILLVLLFIALTHSISINTSQSAETSGAIDKKKDTANLKMPWFENVDFKRNIKKELHEENSDDKNTKFTKELRNGVEEKADTHNIGQQDGEKASSFIKRESKKYRRSNGKKNQKKTNLFLILEQLLMKNIAKEFKNLRSKQPDDAPGLAWKRQIALKQAPNLPWKKSTKRQAISLGALKLSRFYGDMTSLDNQDIAKKQSVGIWRPRFSGDSTYQRVISNTGIGATRFFGDHQTGSKSGPRFFGDSLKADQPERPFIVFSKTRFSGDQQSGPYTGSSATRFFGDQENPLSGYGSNRFFGDQPDTSSPRFFGDSMNQDNPMTGAGATRFFGDVHYQEGPNVGPRFFGDMLNQNIPTSGSGATRFFGDAGRLSVEKSNDQSSKKESVEADDISMKNIRSKRQMILTDLAYPKPKRIPTAVSSGLTRFSGSRNRFSGDSRQTKKSNIPWYENLEEGAEGRKKPMKIGGI